MFCAGVAILCTSLSAWCFQLNRRQAFGTKTMGYILENQVTHVRFLPVESSHAFTYPTIAFLMSLNALEQHELDLWKGRLFGYGGRWMRLTGVRANPYFADVVNSIGGPQTIREKLVELLIERGVRIHLYTSSTTDDPKIPGPLKLTALLRPTASYPLTVPNLLLSLSCAPFTLLLSLLRILAQAWILHYHKRLDVFIRPEPFPPTKKAEFSAWSSMRRGGGVKWQGESQLERYARLRVHQFFQRRVEEIGLRVSFVSSDPAVPDLILAPRESSQGGPEHHLIITYLAPRFFTILLAAPSPQHALLVGSDTERVFSVSSRELFTTVFSSPLAGPPSHSSSSLQRLRAQRIPPSIPLPIPALHPLDPLFPSCVENLKHKFALHALFCFEHLERWMFLVMRARVVEGDEPWEAWTRAEKVLKGMSESNTINERTSRGEWGSVRNA
ncbi:hypothetical protein C0992_000273 [Termitomyces sp. T32_za158]|nr:hypothetical protein C0992_000273 [Termitomyces sp. T32_za158]